MDSGFLDKKIQKEFEITINENREKLERYCEWLGNRCNDTNDGTYRIKYNALYDVLFSPITDPVIRNQIWNSFMTSANVEPIILKNSGTIEVVYF